MKFNLLTAATLMTLAAAPTASAALLAGDIAFTGFLADGDDGFAVVALTDIAAGEEIYFRDDEWDGSAFGTGEGEFLWTTPALAAGTVATFVTDAGGTPTVSLGAISADPAFAPGDMGISGSGETIFAYQGTSNTPATFLAAVGSDTSGIQDTIAGTGLVVGTTAIELGGDIDGSQYIGARDTELALADYLPLVNNPANWSTPVNGSGDQSGDVLPFDTTAFTVIPEPSAVVMGLLAACGLTATRRR